MPSPGSARPTPHPPRSLYQYRNQPYSQGLFEESTCWRFIFWDKHFLYKNTFCTNRNVQRIVCTLFFVRKSCFLLMFCTKNIFVQKSCLYIFFAHVYMIAQSHFRRVQRASTSFEQLSVCGPLPAGLRRCNRGRAVQGLDCKLKNLYAALVAHAVPPFLRAAMAVQKSTTIGDKDEF